MIPHADAIIQEATATAAKAAEALTNAQTRTRLGIIAAGIAMVALCLGFSWLIGLSITRSLTGLSAAMTRLADRRDLGAIFPPPKIATRSATWRAPCSSSATAWSSEKSWPPTRLRQRSNRYSAAIRSRCRIDEFRSSVEAALGKLRGAALKLEMTSTDLNQVADTVSAEARSAEQRVNGASDNVTAAATLGRGVGDLDRRNRQPGSEIHRSCAARRLGDATYRLDHG